ncbi:hypothetical protein CPB83DRAFT_891333 [Crepidotus variabilis]|uniref:Uncharacterized protein n=1 Tax=Crepidotus variabilis TaxID=179855 RepID=A0A9P6EN15_9AGAR|nr:hypothetical protein CPB83DRAFT_891333 [Crepidotus variabilis]
MDPYRPVDYSYAVQYSQQQPEQVFDVGIPHPNFFASRQPFEVPKLYAPVPMPGQSPLLYSEFSSPGAYSTEGSPRDPQISANELAICDLQQAPLAPSPLSVDHEPQTFPTPSELLADISTSGDGLPTVSPNATEDSAASELRSETARKARRRAMAESVGFVPTDPDTISSHDKKRHYLECIEQYIQYLHQQFELVGEAPPPIERVAAYRGLSNRSIRTLLVHMEHNTRRMNDQTVSEEDRFLSLRNEIYVKEGIQPQY